MSNEIVKRKLPTLAELAKEDYLPALKKRDELNYLLNQPTPSSWIKKHPFVNIKVGEQNGQDSKEPLQYVAVERVKMSLIMIYGGFTTQIISVMQLFNAVAVTVRLTVKDPITGEDVSQDGVGAVGVQTDKGASASDLGAIKQDAVMKALPAAASYALKNAAEKFGNIFGGALQKYDLSSYVPVYNDELKDAINDKVKEVKEQFNKAANG